MRLSGILTAAGTATFLVACAGKAPAPSQAPVAPGLLASWKNGSVDQTGWENWMRNSGVPLQTPASEQPRMFTDYIRYQLDALAAADAGLTSDKAKSERWASIVERILSDKVRREFVAGQHGFSDSAITAWAAKQDSTVRKLPMDSLRARGGRSLALAGVKLDSMYKANKESFKKDSANYRPFDSVKAELESIYLQGHVEKMQRDLISDLRNRYGVKLLTPQRPEPPEDSLVAFWKRNPERWTSQPVYRLVALGSKDSAKLSKAVAGVKDLAGFKKLAAKFPVGTPVAPEGVLGRVKHQFALPYGMGMAPDLFTQLDGAKVGQILKPFKANDSLFLSVYLEGRDSSTIKPYASVKAEVQRMWFEANPWSPATVTVLATWDKGALFTKGDVDFISEEVPMHMRRQFPSERVLEFMINWKISARYARENGVDNRPGVQQVVSDNEKIYWSQEWRQTPQVAMFLFDKKDADAATTAWKDSLFSGSMSVDSSKGANRDGARLLLMGKNALREAYLVDIDKYRRDSVVLPYDSVRSQIYSDLRTSLDDKGRDRIDSILKVRYDFKIYPAAPQVPAKQPYGPAFDSARSAHDRRALDQAEALYRQVEKDTLAPDSVRAQALFQLGQLYGEQQNYPRSLSAYRSVLVRFGKSNEAYKAQFMIAFTFSEYLKNEKVALVEYGKMLTDFPKSDLTDDADWMIRNIKSGGALMPKFDDSAFVADSIARADSLKKANAKVDTTKKAAPAVKAEAPKAVKDTAKKVAPAVKAEAPKAVKDTAKKAAPAIKAEAPKAVKDTAKKVVPAVKAATPAKVDTAKAGAKK